MVPIHDQSRALGYFPHKIAEGVVQVAGGIEVTFDLCFRFPKELHLRGFDLFEWHMRVEGNGKDTGAFFRSQRFEEALEQFRITNTQHTGLEMSFNQLFLEKHAVETQMLEDRAAIVKERIISMVKERLESLALHVRGQRVRKFQTGQSIRHH